MNGYACNRNVPKKQKSRSKAAFLFFYADVDALRLFWHLVSFSAVQDRIKWPKIPVHVQTTDVFAAYWNYMVDIMRDGRCFIQLPCCNVDCFYRTHIGPRWSCL